MVSTLEVNDAIHVEAATATWFKIITPDNLEGFVNASQVSMLGKPIRSITVANDINLLEEPVTASPTKALLVKGKIIQVLANFKSYLYVSSQDNEGWINKTSL